ncbi:MAG: SpoIVB peptidase [Clostridium sp.]|nr:SpoIVB peptidase [Clostridium sp.]MCM1443990.1 SpoIVB peptidase [Candidatus Amulumruptor caecigallinarius]
MIKKKSLKTFLILLTLLIIPSKVLGYSDYLIVGGENVGIKLNSKGVMIVGMYSIDNTIPAKEAGLQVGDLINSINDDKVSTVYDLSSKISTCNDENIKIGYVRNDMQKYTNLKLYKTDNEYKTGMYIKDSITGIGTLTFIDPNTKLFGALGHEIIEKNTNKILDSSDGTIFKSTVTGVKESTSGNPGEKNAKLDTKSIKGTINENTTHGIFGNYTDEIPEKKLYKVANIDDIKIGDASILTVLDDNEIGEYNIEIKKINQTSNDTKNILFEITDEKLIEKTGGIIQGMSGSPIIQGDFIVGAVTHVIIEEPTKGYGIFITNMLEEAEN